MPARAWDRARTEYGRIVNEVQPALFQRAQCLTRDRDEASDLVQATLERGYRSFEQYQAGTNPVRWLSTIMINYFIDEFRRERPMRHAASLDRVEVPAPPPEEVPVWANFQHEEIREAAARLPDYCRCPFEMRSFERLSYREISLRLGLPMSTVGSRVFRARQHMKRLLLAKVGRATEEADALAA